jgi:hypothetical protein
VAGMLSGGHGNYLREVESYVESIRLNFRKQALEDLTYQFLDRLLFGN